MLFVGGGIFLIGLFTVSPLALVVGALVMMVGAAFDDTPD